MKLSLRELLFQKYLLLNQLEQQLGQESKSKASSDYHAKKPPRPCGFTVHTVIGCRFACTYCYLPDMGISTTVPQIYGLNGEEITYALLRNKYFLPTRKGSLIAIGSVGEPFVDTQGAQRTIEYVSSFERYLGNPIQFSTKAIVPEEVINWLSKRKIPINPLITIVTLKHAKVLEPQAPDPYDRLDTMKKMRKHGLHPMLFLRPIIPGTTTEELEDIIKEAKNHGAEGVVIGSLRVTPLILTRLEKFGVNTREIKDRIRDKSLQPGKQVSVPMREYKEQAIQISRQNGLIPFLSACCASNYVAYLYSGERVPCPGLDYIKGDFCTVCPVNCPALKTEVDEGEVKEYVEKFLNTKNLKIEVEDKYIFIYGVKDRLKDHQRYLLETGFRRRVVFRR
uniref:Radical SAM protein n=1 Tax=Thermofilum adornatum TaxID=1365176 RepID=A0A7C1CDQ9_9CREN